MRYAQNDPSHIGNLIFTLRKNSNEILKLVYIQNSFHQFSLVNRFTNYCSRR